MIHNTIHRRIAVVDLPETPHATCTCSLKPAPADGTPWYALAGGIAALVALVEYFRSRR